MNKIYRIHTENVGRKAIAELVSKYFKGFTILDASGYYEGKAERSLVIEIMAPVAMCHVVRFIGKAICSLNNQECVLITHEPIEAEYVS